VHAVDEIAVTVLLAADPAHAATKARLADALDKSLKDQLDPGVPLDTPAAFEAAGALEPSFPGKP
jgi:hypothetical protein